MLRQAASRRSSQPNLPFNPRNPYDTSAVTSESASITSSIEMQSQHVLLDEDAQSTVSGISSAYSSIMPPPAIPSRSQTPQSRRRHQSQRSAEEIENQAHAQRMQGMRQRVEALRRQKEEAELMRDEIKLRKEIEELETWTQQNKET